MILTRISFPYFLKSAVLFSFLFAGPRLALAQNGLTVIDLQQAEERALANNPLLEDARRDLAVVQAKFQQTKNERILPEFNLRNVWLPVPQQRGVVDSLTGYLTSPDKQDEINELRYATQLEINLHQPLYSFGRYENQTLAAGHEVEAAGAAIAKQEAETLLQVRQLYWGLVLGKELLAVIQDAQNEMQKAESKLQEKLDAGAEDVGQSDLFKLQTYKYEINKRRREAQDRLALARATLKAGLGIPASDSVGVAAEYLEPVDFKVDSLENYLELALNNRPELRRQQAETAGAQRLADAERSKRYPEFFLGAEAKANYAKDRYRPSNPFVNRSTNYVRPNPFVGVRQNLNFWQSRDNQQVALQRHEIAEQECVELRQQIKLEVQKAFTELLQVEANMRESRRALRASENWLRSTSMTFDIGVGDVSGLIDAYQANSKMKAENLQNIFEFNIAVAKLQKAIGVELSSQ